MSTKNKGKRSKSKSPVRAAHITNKDGSVKNIPLTALFEPPTPGQTQGSDEIDTHESTEEANLTIESLTIAEPNDEIKKESQETIEPAEKTNSVGTNLVPNPPFGSSDDERIPIAVSFGPNNSWFIRWNDGTSAYDKLPPTLHGKLSSRLPTLPGVRHLSMSDTSDWFVSFDDGSFATSGFTTGKLYEALNSGDTDITLLVFAPGGGFLLVREDATMVWDRLPTGLANLLSVRTAIDAPIESVSISQLGSWFVRFEDHKCVWEGLPTRLVTLISAVLRRDPPHMIVVLSPNVISQYLIAVGAAYDYNMTTIPALEHAIAFSKSEPNDLTASISYTLPKKAPKIKSKDFDFIFRSTPKEDGTGAFDDELGGILTPTGLSTENLTDDIVSPKLLQPNIPEPGIWGGTIRSRNASFDVQNLGINVTTPTGSMDINKADSPEIFPSDLNKGSPTLQIGNILNSVSTLWGNYKHHFVSEQPKSASSNPQTASGFSTPKHYSGQITDYSEEQISALISRLRNMQMIIENKLSQSTAEDDPQIEHLVRLGDHLSKLSISPYPIHETEYFILYTEGFVEALSPRGVPHPYMEGYIEGRFGISSQDVSDAVEMWIASKADPILNTDNNREHNRINADNDDNEHDQASIAESVPEQKIENKLERNIISADNDDNEHDQASIVESAPEQIIENDREHNIISADNDDNEHDHASIPESDTEHIIENKLERVSDSEPEFDPTYEIESQISSSEINSPEAITMTDPDEI